MVFVRSCQTGAPDGGGSPEVKEFDGLSHEGVEAFWQQLQLQVSQWMMREQQINWTFDGEAEPSQFFSPHFDMSDGVNASDKEGAGGSRAPDVFGTATRRRVSTEGHGNSHVESLQQHNARAMDTVLLLRRPS